MTRILIIALALAACAPGGMLSPCTKAETDIHGNPLYVCNGPVPKSCARSETGGQFTSNVDGEGNLLYACH